MERKRLVLDANILIRGCLGVRVRNLIADYADRVDFFVAEANVAEAAGYTNVTITSGHAAQFTCNSRCNALVTGPYYCAAVWTLTMTGTQNTAFEALANKIKPAHTRLLFVYV